MLQLSYSKNMQKREFRKIKKQRSQGTSHFCKKWTDIISHHITFALSLYPLRFTLYRSRLQQESTKVSLYGKDLCYKNFPKFRKEFMDDHLLKESKRKGEPLIFTLWDAEKGHYITFLSGHDKNLSRLQCYVDWLVHFIEREKLLKNIL